MIVTVIAYASTAWVLGAYAWMVRTGNQRVFDLANAWGCFPLIVANTITGGYWAAVMNAVFGTIGWVGLFRARRARKYLDLSAQLNRATYGAGLDPRLWLTSVDDYRAQYADEPPVIHWHAMGPYDQEA